MEKIKEIFEENKIIIISCFITLFLSILLIGVIYYYTYNNIKEINEKIISMQTNNEKIEKLEKQDQYEIAYVYVDIKGEVKKPGTYKMNKEDRVIDVIEKAGGLTSNASTRANNLSKKVTDEMVIIIYSKNEITNFSKTKEIEEKISINCNNASNNYSDTNLSCIEKPTPSKTEKENKVSLNAASKEELMSVKGIGESKADSIIKYRKEKGLFKSVEDLKQISGIGDNIYDKIKDYFTL